MNMFAICGYRRTGKDAFVRDVINGAFKMDGEVKWEVFSRNEALPSLMLPKGSAVRYAFADSVKDEVHKSLGLRNCAADTFETVKDQMSYRGRTLREWYIHVGESAKRDNPTAWSDIVYGKIDKSRPALISDLRFRAELRPPAWTVRLFRAEVQVPPAADASEHDLDAVATDYLLVPPGQFEAARAAFPQYAAYRLAARLCV